MKASYDDIENLIKTTLQAKCDELSVVYTGNETNSELCTLINNA